MQKIDTESYFWIRQEFLKQWQAESLVWLTLSYVASDQDNTAQHFMVAVAVVVNLFE